MPEPTIVMPNPFSPYADADPLYRHLFPVFAPKLVGDPAPGSLVLTTCERMTVVPDEPLTYTDEVEGPLPDGLCPLCLAVRRGAAPPRLPATECQRCESTTRHNGLCALCRQEQHADWWQASDTWARPFRIVQGKNVLDGAVFPNGQAIVIDDPETGLSSSAESLELLLTGYHRAEVLLADEVIRVGTARVHHAVGEYARMAIDLSDTRTELDKAQAERDELHAELGLARGQLHSAAVSAIRGKNANIRELIERAERGEASVERARKLATQWAVLRAYGGAATELRRALDGRSQPVSAAPDA